MPTKKLAESIADFSLDSIPPPVLHEAKRALLNWLGVAIGSHTQPPVQMMLNIATDACAPQAATVIGTSRRVDWFAAAVCNGISSSLYDFDDTHMETIIHPSCPVLPALLAWSECRPMTGGQLLRLFVVGVEVETRIGLYLTKAGHYDKGWHMTGTAGTFGAAAAIGKALGLPGEQMLHTLAIAASQAAGIRGNFGTPTKAIHAGKAAANGMLAALLAANGMTGSEKALEGPCGYGPLCSDSRKTEWLTAPWGEEYQIMRNTYKPYACAVVEFPVIEAALKLRRQGIAPAAIQAIRLRVYRLAIEITGRQAPKNHLKAANSIYHAFAVAFVTGEAGLREHGDAWINHPDVLAVRHKISAVADDSLAIHQAVAVIEAADGRCCRAEVDGTRGGLENPLTDGDLENKFRTLTQDYLNREAQNRVCETVWQMERAADTRTLIGLCAGE